MGMIYHVEANRCATCQYWRGDRKRTPTGQVEVRDGATGICGNNDCPNKGKTMKQYESCTKIKKV